MCDDAFAVAALTAPWTVRLPHPFRPPEDSLVAPSPSHSSASMGGRVPKCFTMPPGTLTRTLQCSYCEKTFVRPEHRRRHELIHSKKHQFSCSICSKDFTRRYASSLRRPLLEGAPYPAPSNADAGTFVPSKICFDLVQDH